MWKRKLDGRFLKLYVAGMRNFKTVSRYFLAASYLFTLVTAAGSHFHMDLDHHDQDLVFHSHEDFFNTNHDAGFESHETDHAVVIVKNEATQRKTQAPLNNQNFQVTEIERFQSDDPFPDDFSLVFESPPKFIPPFDLSNFGRSPPIS
ncbi:hypothetical protein JNL27_09785 [bacterium]|nr:hypothetical protein [bacterium]